MSDILGREKLLKLGGSVDQSGKNNKSFTLESSLQSYFYTQLQEINEKSQEPLPNETIYYSSLVMDSFGDAEKYFEKEEGKVRDKILGIKLLKTSHMTKEERKRSLKDIGDTALLICGFFSDSLNKKILDTKYYQELGQTAYRRLNSEVPQAYDIPSFFDIISMRFDQLTTVMNLVSAQTLGRDDLLDSAYLITNKKLAV